MHRLTPTTLATSFPAPAAAATTAKWVLAHSLCWAMGFSTFAAELQINDLNDVDFGEVPPTIGTLRSTSALCVSMQPRGRYSLVGFGNGSGGAFSLVDTGNGVHEIDYSVRVSDRGRRRGQALAAGIPLTGLRASRFRNNGRCNPQGQIRVIIDGADIQSANPGQYAGTLILTVAPE